MRLRAEVMRDGSHILTLFPVFPVLIIIVQGSVGPRGDPGAAGPPGNPVSVVGQLAQFGFDSLVQSLIMSIKVVMWENLSNMAERS